MIKVSIIVPVYNVEKYVGKCLDSILAQTYKDFECIIINDGSTDKSCEIVREYAKRDERLRIIEQKNAGLSAARNAGLKEARGEYIQFIDSDDFVEPELLEKCINALEGSIADIAVFGFLRYYNESKENIQTKEKNDNKTYDFKVEYNKTYNLNEKPDILFNVLPAAWSKMYRRKLFIENEIFYPEGFLFEDLGTTYRLLWRASGIIFIDDFLYNYRLDRDERISKRTDSKILDCIYMLDDILYDYYDNGLYDKFYEELKAIVISNTYWNIQKIFENKKISSLIYILPILKYCIEIFPEFPRNIYYKHLKNVCWVNKNGSMRIILKIFFIPAKIWLIKNKNMLQGYMHIIKKID